MKIHKKSLLIGSASLILLGGCSLFNAQNTSQQSESETTTTTEISKAYLAKFEKIAEEVKENKPKTIVGEVFENGYLKKHGGSLPFCIRSSSSRCYL